MEGKHKIYIITIATLIILLSLTLIYSKKYKVYSIQNTYEYSKVGYKNLTFDTAKIKPENINSLVFYYKNEKDQKINAIQQLKNQKNKLIFATNGGIFSEVYKPLGLYIEKGQTISKINTGTGEGNFYFQPNGIFLIKDNQTKIIETKEYQNSPDISFAIQSGPLLVSNNKINPSFRKDSENKYIRSGVGIDKNGNTIFAISNKPVSFYEFANFFKEKLGCSEALYLDGAISEMYIPGHREATQEKFGIIIGIIYKEIK